MFGRKGRKDAEASNSEAAQIAHEQKLAEYWKARFDQAKDGHETTQVCIDYRHHRLLESLRDFDQRIAKELRDHARQLRQLRYAVYAMGVLIVVLHWL